MKVAHTMMEDKPEQGGGSMVNGSVVFKGNGSMVNGSSICNSDVGPSASVVAAAIANGLYKPQQGQPQNNESKQIKEWTKKEKQEEGRWPAGPPAGSFVAVPKGRSIKARSTKGKAGGEGTKFFSCFGCEVSVTCGGEGGRKNKHEDDSNRIRDLSSVDDFSNIQ